MFILSRVLCRRSHSEKSPRGSRIPLSPTPLRDHKEDSSNSPFRLNIKLESPPIALYGHAHESSGYILSGVLTLDVLDSHETSLNPVLNSSLSLSPTNLVSSSAPVLIGKVFLDSVTLQLVQTFHLTKPFMPTSNLILACKMCASRKAVLAEWDVSLLRCTFPIGSYAYPFSHLLPGLLTGSSKLGDVTSSTYIRYELVAIAKSADSIVQAALPLEILRSILRGPDKNSLRVFPPTEVVTSAVLPGIVYPKSTMPIELRMENIVNESQTKRWRMRKLSWKLEESTQVRAYACELHQAKLETIKANQKSLQSLKALKIAAKKNSRVSFESTSRISSMHHLNVQTLMFVSHTPTNRSAHFLLVFQELQGRQAVGNQDTEIPVENAPTNRISDEVINFEEDFGSTASLSEDRPVGSSDPRFSYPVTTGSSDTHELAPEDLYINELRVVARGDVRSGWKSDFLGRGRIELVLDVNILSCSTGTRLNVNEVSSDNPIDKSKIEVLLNDANVCCDINDPVLGLYVSHLLVIEMIVAEEQIRPTRSDSLHPVSSSSCGGASNFQTGIPTGAARVLRMQFKVILSERSGLGIAWDDEVPPTYHDVKALSPPNYALLDTNTPLSLVGVSVGTPTVLFDVGQNVSEQA